MSSMEFAIAPPDSPVAAALQMLRGAQARGLAGKVERRLRDAPLRSNSRKTMIDFRRTGRTRPAPSEALAAFWSMPPSDLMDALASGPEGLTQDNADRRLALHGENSVKAHDSVSAWRLFGRQLANPLVWVLIFGTVVALVLSEWLNGGSSWRSCSAARSSASRRNIAPPPRSPSCAPGWPAR